jgi:hypothetical protein
VRRGPQGGAGLSHDMRGDEAVSKDDFVEHLTNPDHQVHI